MRVAQIQFSPWDKKYDFNPTNYILSIGDKVIVKTELGAELGRVVGFRELAESDSKEGNTIRPILRKVSLIDLEKMPSEKQKKDDFDYCKKLIDRCQLVMKLVDLHYSFDGSRITFYFVADGRVDFRELVKELTKHHNRTIRLQQIGIRDEARLSGDYGHCGRPLCCGKFLRELSSITSDLAELQQCAHRGSDRISGICGRLICCLAYEEEGYKKLLENFPIIGSEIKIEGKKGKVVGHHILKQTVDVEVYGSSGEGSAVIEVDIKKIK